MALMLAGGVIATVVNMLGSLPGSIIFYLIIFLIGHVFNMGLNIVGTYVHASRLQYLEFFGKFYRDGGKPFTPLSLKTKYVDIIKEEN
jgi:V/A-type H+-transporting ATPase subunit I